jgi:carbon storage regulator
MLVLTRKLYESIRIGPDIVVHVTLIAGDTVRIGIDAPDDVKILRTELLDRGEWGQGRKR